MIRLLRRKSKPEPLDLTPYRGNWVAVKHGQLVAHAPTAQAIIDTLVALGDAGRGTTCWFEEHPEKVQRWAVKGANGRIGPNCRFDTREQAERWLRSCPEEGSHVVTRDGQHDPWRPVPEVSDVD